MKKAILALVLIFIFVIIFIPLVYIATGKTKSPLENLATKAGTNASGGVLGKNYAPAPSDYSDIGEKKKQEDEYNAVIKKCFSKMDIQYGGAFLISQDKGALHTISNADAHFLWTTKDFLIEEAKTDKERRSIKNGAYIIVSAPTEECLASSTVGVVKSQTSGVGGASVTGVLGVSGGGQSLNTMFARYNDEGYMLTQLYNANTNPAQFDVTEKGVADINSRRYYWYLFEDVSRLDAAFNPESTVVKKNQVTAVTIDNGLMYKFVFSGDSTMFGKARTFVAKTQEFLAGFRYGI